MERKQLLILIVISFLLCNVVAYLDEGIRTFEYLTMPGDWVALVMYTIIFLVLPLLLFFGFKKSKLRFPISLSGFLPILYFISMQLSYH